MDLEDKFLAKVSGVQSLSSSAQSTPEKNGHSDDATKSPELLQEFLKLCPKKELLRSLVDKEKNISASAKTKVSELRKITSKTIKKQDSKKAASSPNNQSSSRKQLRKAENPSRLPTVTDLSSKSWTCKNSACKAVLSVDVTFCKRCSCCICHLYDDNKDPSLWLVCGTESGEGDSCGLSCHIECAIQREKVGVVDLGQLMQLDGSYCCASCGKVTGILRCWKKQLVVARDARRVDVLCYRIYTSYRLLDGSSRFKEMHEIVKDAKGRLEGEVGPLDGISDKMARGGIVNRLSVAADLQTLCSLAIEKADKWLALAASTSSVNPNSQEDSLPPACKFLFEETTPSSVVIILVELTNVSSNDVAGYKLWYGKTREEEKLQKEPICTFPRSQRRILVSNLQPCTEYTFRIVSYTENGDLGHSETRHFTKSLEIIPTNCRRVHQVEASAGSTTPFKILHFPAMKPPESPEPSPPASRDLDLNVVTVPDLNEEVTPPFESSRDENDGCCPLQQADDDAASHDKQKDILVTSNGSGDSQTWTYRKRGSSSNEEIHDCDSTLINGSPLRSNGSCCLDENFEYCVKIIRWLECEGFIKQEFRLKLLTWYSLRSTERERRVVNSFIQTLIDDPSSLAGQLVDSFSDIVSCKRLRN